MEVRKMIRKRIKFIMIPHNGMFAVCSILSLAGGTAWRGERQGRHRQLRWHNAKWHFSVMVFV
jgi:hypothetical protein